jgi:transcriptional regulator with XRE-family HTH domain
MSQDWSAVGAALRERLDEQGMTMTDLATRSGVSLTTVRELVHVLNTRRRQPRILESLSVALGWPPGHLGAVLRGRSADTAVPSRDLAEVRRELRELRQRVEALERAAGRST